MIHRLLIAVAAATLLCGCATSANLSAWQHSVEQYVREDGKGDPAILATVHLDDSRPGFALLGADHPDHSDDVNGLLLGHKLAANRPWFIYLVGEVKKQKVTDIRLTALAVDNTGHFTWRTTPANKQALETYKHYNEQLYKKRMPNHPKEPPDYTTFPRKEDPFDLTIENNSAKALHPPSGAHWELSLH